MKKDFIFSLIIAFFAELFATIIVKISVEIVPAYKIAIILVFIIIIILLRKFIFYLYKELTQMAPTISRIILILIFLIVPIIIGNYVGDKTNQILRPVYEITIPKPNSEVDQIITVGGHGAIPSSEIKVFVIDDNGNRWLEGTTFPDTGGSWELYPVYIGRPNGADKGKMYVIYASMTTQNGTVYNSKKVSVRRK
ncbi:MAG: hypothetical protein WA102_00110 [Candidatus Methanoperedens sp.]